MDRALPEILTNPALRLAGSFRVLLSQLQLELEQLSARIEQMDAVIQQTAEENEACQRLTAIPGVGPMTAMALVAAFGNGAGFWRGKDPAAWVGMVPREYSTGGKQKLLGISKRGNSYLRRLFVQGARVVMPTASVKALRPLAASGIVPVPICAPVSSRMITGTFTARGETLFTATPADAMFAALDEAHRQHEYHAPNSTTTRSSTATAPIYATRRCS